MKMVDVCVGLMSPDEIDRELHHYLGKKPQRLVIKIIKIGKKYQTAIWISKKDFDEKC